MMQHLSTLVLVLTLCLPTSPARAIEGWPDKVVEIEYLSQADNSQQPALYFDPGGSSKKPLLVALHSWSGNYKQANGPYGQWCIDHDWVMIHPNFRGLNDHPQACGSELVVKDILSAVEHCRQKCAIDEQRIYLVGSSGGGYASLLMAGRAPQVWAGVSAWCPIYDLATWHGDTRKRDLRYDDMLEKVCGGPPGTSKEVDQQYQVRSASHWLQQARGKVNLSINTGITDGHDGSVPVGHTLRAFNAVAEAKHAISDETIAAMEREPKMPANLTQSIDDTSFGKKTPLFRRRSQSAEVTIFQGGHEIVYAAALSWLEKQRRDPNKTE